MRGGDREVSDPPREVVTACVYWVLHREGATGWVREEEVLERVRAMTAEEIREARALHARVSDAGDA